VADQRGGNPGNEKNKAATKIETMIFGISRMRAFAQEWSLSQIWAKPSFTAAASAAIRAYIFRAELYQNGMMRHGVPLFIEMKKIVVKIPAPTRQRPSCAAVLLWP
jgi:hypothetical protein